MEQRAKAISRAEDRDLFRKSMKEINLDLPKSEIVNSFDKSKKVLKKIGLPAIIRPSLLWVVQVEELQKIKKNSSI